MNTLQIYRQLAFVADRVLRRAGVRTWTRNGMRTGNVQLLVSDIDLTIDCRTVSREDALAVLRKYRSLRRFVPVLGEANWLFSDSISFLAKYGNPLEIARDPELETLLRPSGLRAPTDSARAVFLLRMLVADRRNLMKRPAARSGKWVRHLRAAGVEHFGAEIDLASLFGGIEDLLETVLGISARSRLRQIVFERGRPGASAGELHLLVFYREWLGEAMRSGLRWAESEMKKMSDGGLRVFREQLLWELAYICMSEAAIENPEVAKKHADLLLELMRIAHREDANAWAALREEFARTGTSCSETACHDVFSGSGNEELDRLCVGPKGEVSLWEDLEGLSVRVTADISIGDILKSAPVRAARKERANAPISRLHLSMGNKCDLTCLMCSNRFSSAWDALLSGGNPQSFDKCVEWFEDQRFFDRLPEVLPDLRQVILAGGEPLESRGHERFLDACLASGHAARMKLEYRSCALPDPASFAEKWKRFGSVTVHALLDGHFEAEPYMKYPLSWGEFAARLRRYDELPDFVKVELVHQVHALSIFYLPELCDWIRSQQFRRIRTGRGGAELLLEHVPERSFLSLRNCPDDLRGRSLEKIAGCDLSDFVARSEIDRLVARSVTKGGSPNTLFGTCRAIDKARGSCFEQAFPELYPYFERAGARSVL